MFITGMSSSSLYSDSSSELLSSSDELVSVGVDGDLIAVKLLSSRKLVILSITGLTPELNAFSLVNDGFVSLGGRAFLVEIRAGVNKPKREVNHDNSCEYLSRLAFLTYGTDQIPEQGLFRSVTFSGDI
jgi:hypothetical protein